MDDKRCGVNGFGTCEGVLQEASCMFRGCTYAIRRCRLHGAGGKLAKVMVDHMAIVHGANRYRVAKATNKGVMPSITIAEQIRRDHGVLKGCDNLSCFVKSPRGGGMIVASRCRCFGDVWRDLTIDQRIQIRLLARMARNGHELAKEQP